MAILAQLVDDVVVHRFELNKATTTIGRHPDNDIVIDDSAVSAWHARVYLERNPDFQNFLDIYIEDVESTNGTYLNELKLSNKQRLHHGDVIRVAWNQFTLINPQEEEMGQTVHMVKSEPV